MGTVNRGDIGQKKPKQKQASACPGHGSALRDWDSRAVAPPGGCHAPLSHTVVVWNPVTSNLFSPDLVSAWLKLRLSIISLPSVLLRLSRPSSVSACSALSKMSLTGLKGHWVLGHVPSVFLLVLLLLGPSQPLIWTQTKPGISGASTTSSIPRALTKSDISSIPTTPGNFPDLRDRARALMQEFPLIDGYVRMAWDWSE